jgi:hypothetical protein
VLFKILLPLPEFANVINVEGLEFVAFIVKSVADADNVILEPAIRPFVVKLGLVELFKILLPLPEFANVINVGGGGG